MSILESLKTRAGNQCEISQATEELVLYALPPESDENDADKCILISKTLSEQLSGDLPLNPADWRGLSEAIWSTVPAVQALAYRQLNALSSESWAQDCLDIAYLEDEVKSWAEASMVNEEVTPTLDSNGTVLQSGDNVTIIKDLQVKGGGFTAKRGTAVRGISLTDNPEHIEGRVNGQRIVLVAKFLKKM